MYDLINHTLVYTRGGNIMKENRGFSLVELIIVIAIMAVLIGLLAPQFIKYVEQSRRSRDIQSADQIREAFLADIAEGNTSGAGSIAVTIEVNSAYLPGTINETPKVSGHVIPPGGTFTVSYDADLNQVKVYPTGYPTYDLTSEAGINAYKAA